MTTLTAPTTTGTYTIDPTHSRIGFVARHAMVTKVRGSFNEFEGSGYFDAENPAGSSLRLTIQAASIDTRNADRDGHLKSNDFFDMATYPEITFVSTAVEQADDTTYRVTGDLTIKGTTKPVVVDFEYAGTAVDPYNNQRIGFEGTTTVNRKDWGVNWNAALDAGGVLVGEKVTLEFEVSAIRTDPTA
jgi:polyisoprenoid-binding protein YceI